MRVLLILILSLISTFALAQEAKFVPYIINQDDHSKIMTYLGEQPAKFSLPLIQALSTLAQKAIEEKLKKEKEENK